MLRRTTIVGSVLSLVLAGVGVASATSTYTFTTLTPAGSDTQAYALAMNLVNGVPLAAGVTGGGTTNMNQGYPCIWNSAGTGTDVLSYIPGSPTRGKAWAMDTSGDIVGNEKVSTGQLPYFLAYNSTSGVTLPQVTGSDTYTVAYGVQNSSTVVGIEGAAAPVTNGAIWTKTGSTWSAAALPNLGWAGSTTSDSYCGAYGISSSGIIVGSALAATSGMMTAVEWTNSGSGWVASDLITHTVTQNYSGLARATAVNDSGVAVGYSTYVTSPSMPSAGQHAVIFQGGNPVTLGTLGNGNNNDSANGINDSGVIVGASSTTSGSPLAFIYGLNGNDTMQNMNTVFGSTGYNIIPSGWVLDSAVSIDNNGDIAGWGTYDGYTGVGFVITATVPEPSALLLAAAGLAGLLACAWRKRKQP